MKMSPHSRVTMRQIAGRLGVSHTTVSRALKDDVRISPKMRREVRRIADEMGYRPDPMLSALSHYRRRQEERPVAAELAWVNCWPEPRKVRAWREFELYWQGVFEEARQNGYRLEEFNCPAELTGARLREVLHARGIQGLLLTPGWSGQTPEWGDFDWSEFSVVRFGYSLPFPLAHVASTDQLQNGLLAFQKMWAKGYRRIGLVTWRTQGTRLFRLSAGYLYGQLHAPPENRLKPLLLDEEGPKKDLRRLVAWLEQTHPDAVLTDLSEIPEMLAEAGYRVPEDLGLATGSVLDGNVDAGIYQNSPEVGAAAVQLLISLIHHNQRGIPEIPREVLVPGRWVDGKTLPVK